MSNDLIKKLIEHEGYRRYPYTDTKGNLTIGIGRNISEKSGRGLTRAEAIFLLGNDLKICRNTLNSFVWFRHLNIVRQEVLMELMFNIGAPSFFTFKKMIAALQMNDFRNAEKEMLDSKWARDVGENRAADMAFRMRYGAYKGQHPS